MENQHYREGAEKKAVKMHVDSEVSSSAHLQNQSPIKINSIFQTGTKRNSCPIEWNHLGGAQEYKNYPIVTVVEHKHRTQVSVPPKTTKGDLRQATFCAFVPNQENKKITQPYLTGISPLQVVWHSE